MIPKIVLTGGPCSGKTTGLAYLSEKLSDHGFTVLTIPEIATMTTNSGIDRLKFTPEQYIEWEKSVIDIQLALEDTYTCMASDIYPNDKVVMLLDRGVMDVKAFFAEGSEKEFDQHLLDKGLSLTNIWNRYSAIIHLVTAAEGAREFYTLDNNKARIETPEEAIAVDYKTREMWIGHPHLRLIDNSTDFESKMKETLASVCRILGIPEPLEIERKYLLKNAAVPQMVRVLHQGIPHRCIEIEQMYLSSEGMRIRKRGLIEGTAQYYLTKKQKTDNPLVRVEKEELITEKEYHLLSKMKDPNTRIIKKLRTCFLWNGQHFELDTFDGPNNLELLEIELNSVNSKVELPPFLSIEKEVTDDSQYSNREIARI
jgi:CYTH domain-containing protein/predicted ATPase